MNDNRTIRLAEVPIGGKGGSIWNRLHGEREEICETLVGICGPNFNVTCELLQARLRKIDDALDRLMSGSYGMCSQCSQPVNEMKLNVDPATSLCLDCSQRRMDSDTSPVRAVAVKQNATAEPAGSIFPALH
jgi:hypothetical protein